MAPSRLGGPSKSTRPARRSRTQVESYHESTSSDEDASDLETLATNASRHPPTVSLRSRSNTQRPSYREPSDHESDDEPVELDDGQGEQPERRPSPPVSARSNRSTVHFTRIKRPGSDTTAQSRSLNTIGVEMPSVGTKRRPRERPKNKSSFSKKRIKHDSSLVNDISQTIPPWQSLPYHILFEILLQATYPSPNEKWEARSDMARWLVNLACLCREFQEPALAALYYCPPLFPSSKCHALVNLLSTPRDSLLINYAGKIKVAKLNVDEAMNSAGRYNIRGIPTILVFKGGQVVEQIVGAVPKDQITKAIDRHVG